MHGQDGLALGLLLTAFGFGFRHGIDWDHIAALTDITTTQDTKRRSMSCASMYAVGHALVVFVLGIGAIVFAANLPGFVDGAMTRVVGVTLVVLGVYVLVTLVRQGRDFRMRSRWAIVIEGCTRAWRRLRHSEVVIDHEHEHIDDGHGHDHDPEGFGSATSGLAAGDVLVRTRHRHVHSHVGAMPVDPFATQSSRAAFGIGMLHGIGAETPTQVLIFATAAGAGGRLSGVVVLVFFLCGLLVSNTVVAATATFGALRASRSFRVYATISVFTALFSLVVGSIFLVGQSTGLPALFGG